MMGQPSSDVPASPPPSYIPSLDGMRAVAFFIVFLAHARLGSPFPGNFGVTLFFFLSGYLITTLMRIEFAETGRVDLVQFYLRRSLRILPPFYLVLLTTAALVNAGVFVGDAFLTPVLMQAIHLSNYQLIWNGYLGYPLGTYAYWSLAVEEHFYVVFPWVYVLLRRGGIEPRTQALVLAAICAIALVWRGVLVFAMDVSIDRTYIATDTRIDSILFGCILAIYGNPVLERNRLATPQYARILCPIAALVLFATFVIPGTAFRETARYTIQGMAIFPLFVAAVRSPDWGIFRVLNLAPVRFLGGLSFSLYLLHEVAIYNVYDRFGVPRAVEAGLALALSLVVAIAIHYGVERPLVRVRRRLSYRTRSTRAANTVMGRA